MAKFTSDELLLKEKEYEKQAINQGHDRYNERVTKVKTQGKDVTQLKPESNLIKRDVMKLTSAFEAFMVPGQKGSPSTYKLKAALKEADCYELAYITIRHCLNYG